MASLAISTTNGSLQAQTTSYAFDETSPLIPKTLPENETFSNTQRSHDPVIRQGRSSSVSDTLLNSPLLESSYSVPTTQPATLILTNNGSVARDHLASERTYLAYVRTSLGIASAGIALMQLLQFGQDTKDYAAYFGAISIITGLVVLLFGTRRFFLVQQTLIFGKFPTTVGEVFVISFLLGAIITATFGVILLKQIQLA